MNAVRVVLLALGMQLLAGCGSLGSSEDKLAGLPEFAPSAQLTLDWQVALAGSPIYQLTPAVAGDGVLIVAGTDGVVERRDQGHQGWRKELAAPLSAGVGSDGQLAVVVTRSGEVVALDVEDGSEKWRATVGAEVLSAPSVTATAIAVRASDSRIFGLAPGDGHRMWVYQRPTPPLSLRGQVGLLTLDEVAVAGFPGGRLVALSLANGGALWELSVALPQGTTELERIADVVGSPVLFQKQLCAAAYQGRVACFDATTGNLLWSRDISSAVGLDRDGLRVYVTDDQGAVVALDASTGASVWKQDKLAKRGTGRPLVVGDYVVVSDAEGYVTALRGSDGNLVARQPTDGGDIAAAPVADGIERLAVQTTKGGVFAFSLH